MEIISRSHSRACSFHAYIGEGSSAHSFPECGEGSSNHRHYAYGERVSMSTTESDIGHGSTCGDAFDISNSIGLCKPKHRPRRTAAQRRAQAERSNTRMLCKLLCNLDDLAAHRGNSLNQSGALLRDLLRRPAVGASMPTCRHWLNNRCSYGDSCRFSHCHVYGTSDNVYGTADQNMYYADSHNDDHEPEDSSDSNSGYDMAGTLEHDIEPSDVELHHADSGICSAATSNGYSDRSSCQIGRISHVIDNHGDHNNDNVSATHGNGLDQTDDSINVYDNCKLDCGRVRRLLSDFANYVKTLPEEVPDLVTDSNINIAESECHEHAVHSFVYQEQSDHSHDPHDVLMSRGGHQESYDECHAPDDCHNGQGQSQRDDIDDKIETLGRISAHHYDAAYAFALLPEHLRVEVEQRSESLASGFAGSGRSPGFGREAQHASFESTATIRSKGKGNGSHAIDARVSDDSASAHSESAASGYSAAGPDASASLYTDLLRESNYNKKIAMRLWLTRTFDGHKVESMMRYALVQDAATLRRLMCELPPECNRLEKFAMRYAHKDFIGNGRNVDLALARTMRLLRNPLGAS